MKLVNTVHAEQDGLVVDPERLRAFITEYGLLGIGWRHGRRFPTGADAWLQVDSERANRFVPLRTPAPTFVGESLSERIAPGIIHASLYYKVFFPGVQLADIPIHDADALRAGYSEPIGSMRAVPDNPWRTAQDLMPTLIPRFKPSGREGFGPWWERMAEAVAGEIFEPDTLTHHVTQFAVANEIASTTLDGFRSPTDLPVDIAQVLVPGATIAPLVRLVAHKTGPGLRGELGLDFPSLLDACYAMLALDLAGRNRLFRCEWCSRLCRQRRWAPPNPHYCPPKYPGAQSGSCASKATDWKYRQRKRWNF